MGLPPVSAIPLPDATDPVPPLASPEPDGPEGGAVPGVVAVPGPVPAAVADPGALVVAVDETEPAGVVVEPAAAVGGGAVAVVTPPVVDGAAARLVAPSSPRSPCFAIAPATPPTIRTKMAATRRLRAVVDRVLRAKVPSGGRAIRSAPAAASPRRAGSP